MELPLVHMGALYAAAHGGLIPYVFSSSPATYPFTNREDSVLQQPAPDLSSYWFALVSGRLGRDARFRYDFEDELAVDGTYYEGIVLMGARPDDLALWRRRGYVTDWEHGSALMAHFEPCGIDFTVPAAAANPPPLFDVKVGDHQFLVNKSFPSRIDEDGLAHFDLARSPCGDVTVRAHWDREGDSKTEPRVCSNAGEGGGLSAVISRASHRVACAGITAAR